MGDLGNCVAAMTGMVPVSEYRLSARNPLKLPGGIVAAEHQ
jgi:hypothetical protein